MTLLDLLTLICFTAPLALGIDVGKEVGVVGIIIGMGAGLVAGGLAYFALKKTVYSDEFLGTHESRPQVVRSLIETVAVVWIVFLLVAAGFMAVFSTKFIVQQMAG